MENNDILILESKKYTLNDIKDIENKNINLNLEIINFGVDFPNINIQEYIDVKSDYLFNIFDNNFRNIELEESFYNYISKNNKISLVDFDYKSYIEILINNYLKYDYNILENLNIEEIIDIIKNYKTIENLKNQEIENLNNEKNIINDKLNLIINGIIFINQKINLIKNISNENNVKDSLIDISNYINELLTNFSKNNEDNNDNLPTGKDKNLNPKKYENTNIDLKESYTKGIE